MNDRVFTSTLSAEAEAKRILALNTLQIMDSPVNELYDDITQVAASLTGAKAAFISLIDADRVWFKSSVGIPRGEFRRCDSICQYTIAGNDLLEIEDISADSFFCNNPIVQEPPHWRYYAGVPLTMPGGENIGTLCILDVKPSKITAQQADTLKFLSKTVVHLMSMCRGYTDMDSSQQLLKVLQEINEDFIRTSGNKRDLFKKMLDYVLKVTNCEYGFIGEVFMNEGKTALRTYAITDISWSDETRALFKKYEEQGMLFTNHNTLFGYTLRTGESLITNQPSNDPRKGGMPHGHPPLNSYMGLAIKDSKGNLIGMMGLANKQIGFSEKDELFLQPFLSTCGTMIIALKTLQENAKVEQENKRIYQKLLNAQSIAKLGNWEYEYSTNEVRWSEELYTIYEIENEGEILNYRAYYERVHPDDVERNDAIATAALKEGKGFSFEERVLFPDGRSKVVLISGTPIFDENLNLIRLEGTSQDITERRRKEEEVQRFFNLAVDLFCICSKDGYMLRNSRSFNSATGYPDNVLRAISIMEFIHPDDRDETIEEISFILRGGTSRNFINRFRKKSGEYVTLSWTSTFDEESQLIYAAAKDVTEMMALEQAQIEHKIEAEKSKAKDIFLANMSHEIRTPLNAIIGFNDILSQTVLTAEQRKNVDFIGNASKRLSVLINDILDISKLENGKLDLEHSPFRLEEVARGVVQMHATKAKSKGVKLLFSYDQDLPEVLMGDETRLSQILLNLISNAVKFTEQGSIELRILEQTRAQDSVSVFFEVKDSGIGISKDKLELIFERFTQAESYTTRVYGGTGLGLNIVRSLIDLHKGKLEVDSEPDKGSTFRFSIDYPIASEEDIQAMERPIKATNNHLLADMHVLLVEDNEHNQILAETYLLKHKAVVEIAANGKIAIDLLKNRKYDTILMDIQMPIMDGLTTTQMLRETLKITTPVIACSAHAMASERMKCKEVGMNDYISKPYTEEILVNVLSKYCQRDKGKAHSDIDDFAEVLQSLEEKMSATYVEKVIGVFKQRLPGEILLLEQAIDEQDAKLLENRAHYQSGSMSSLKFKRGYQLAHDAEKAATGDNWQAAQDAGKKLVAYLQELVTYLNTSVN